MAPLLAHGTAGLSENKKRSGLPPARPPPFPTALTAQDPLSQELTVVCEPEGISRFGASAIIVIGTGSTWPPVLITRIINHLPQSSQRLPDVRAGVNYYSDWKVWSPPEWLESISSPSPVFMTFGLDWFLGMNCQPETPSGCPHRPPQCAEQPALHPIPVIPVDQFSIQISPLRAFIVVTASISSPKSANNLGNSIPYHARSR